MLFRSTNLRYLDWIQSRSALVTKLSNGRIGYVHLPNTAIEGNRELFKQFPSQTDKEALIIDDRYNGGGFIPDRLIEVLARKPLNYWKRRGLEPEATPLLSHNGPKAMLINGFWAIVAQQRGRFWLKPTAFPVVQRVTRQHFDQSIRYETAAVVAVVNNQRFFIGLAGKLFE